LLSAALLSILTPLSLFTSTTTSLPPSNISFAIIVVSVVTNATVALLDGVELKNK
jgi:hypothetical protein